MTKSAPPRQLPPALAAALLSLGALALAALTGCPPELSCRELGCDSGFICNRQTGQCEPTSRDCSTGDCPEGQICDPQSGSCRSAVTRCPEQPCSSGQVCNTQTGFCQSSPDCSAGGCASPAEQCNESTGTCIPRPCETDGQCPRGYICGRDATCVAGCRLETPSCPPGTFCRSITGRSNGQCLPECAGDRDCPHGQICTERDGESVCQSEPPCRSDEDCRGDEVCRHSRCSAPPCQSDEDCAAGQVCDRPSGVCVGSECREDMLAPNQRRQEAHPLDFGSYAELRLCPARSDWFSVSADSSEALEFRLEHNARRDPDLFVFDTRGRLVGANQQPPPDGANGRFASSVQVTSHRPQALYLQVLAADRRPRNADAPPAPEALSYDLRVKRSEAEVCSDDDSEENDEPRDATMLTTAPDVPTELGYQICDGDDDWFRLPQLSRRQGLRVGLRDAPDHLQLEVLAPDGTREVVEAGGKLDLHRVATQGDWLLHVSSRRDRSGSYQLLWEVRRPWSCPGRGNHDARPKALSLPAATPTSEMLCPFEKSWEVDWLEMAAPSQKARLELAVRPADALPELEISVFQATDDGATFVRRAVDHDGGYRAVALVEPRKLFVRVHANVSVGRIEGDPTYQVEYSFQPPP